MNQRFPGEALNKSILDFLSARIPAPRETPNTSAFPYELKNDV